MLSPHDGKQYSGRHIAGTAATLTLEFFLLALFACFYPVVPQAVGGGRLEQRDVWVQRQPGTCCVPATSIFLLSICRMRMLSCSEVFGFFTKAGTISSFEEPRALRTLFQRF